jgi:CubicO group peptidase (beta-lactamase class C family)
MKTIARILAAFAALAIAPLHAQSIDVAAIEKVVERVMAKHKLAGVSVGVMHQGKIILARGYGVASLQTREPVTPQTMFAAGSITKQFACVLALQLVDEGKLSMDDRVAKYFPGAARGGEVTLMDLGNHVSGYPDYYPLDFLARRMFKATTPAAIIEQHTKRVDFAPGTRWSYSNTGYLMLGEVVGRVEGMPFERVLERRILGPLGMKHSAYDLGPGAPGAAAGHTSFMLGEVEPVALQAKGWLGAAGGLWTTPSDLLAWDLAVMEGRLLSEASQRTLTTPRWIPNARSNAYACGLGIGERDGMQAWGHAGLISGFTARNVMFPGSKSAIAMMTNVENVGGALFDLYLPIARIILPARVEPPAAAGPPALSVAAELMGQMQAGTPDRSRLGEEFNFFLTSERVQAAAASLGKLGKPKSVEVTSTDDRGGMEHTVILFKFESASAEAEMYRTSDGLVQQFLVSGK